MNITIEWQAPIQLTKFGKIVIDENHLPESIRDKAGVYFFSRKFEKKYIPFYIGRTATLKKRFGDHLKTKKIAFVLRGITDGGAKEIKTGQRYFHFGYVKAGRALNTLRCTKIVEKYLVREALADNYTLLNVKLTAFKTDKITFSGSAKARGIYDKTASVEHFD